jgi:hypothetical protein
MEHEPHQSKAMLRALLAEDPQAQGIIAGLADLSAAERQFLLTTCSATIIAHTVCSIANYDAATGKEGLDALVVSMAEHVERICTDASSVW